MAVTYALSCLARAARHCPSCLLHPAPPATAAAVSRATGVDIVTVSDSSSNTEQASLALCAAALALTLAARPTCVRSAVNAISELLSSLVEGDGAGARQTAGAVLGPAGLGSFFARSLVAAVGGAGVGRVASVAYASVVHSIFHGAQSSRHAREALSATLSAFGVRRAEARGVLPPGGLELLSQLASTASKHRMRRVVSRWLAARVALVPPGA